MKGVLQRLASLGLGTSLFLGLLGFLPGDLALGRAQALPVSQGYELLKKGWVGDAIAAFQAALRQNPQSLEAQLGLATAYQRNGQDAEAWQGYRRVLSLDPQNRTALQALGVLGGYRSEWQVQGIEALTTLLQLQPTDTATRAQRALLLGYQGRFAEALADYEPLLANNPLPEVLLGAAKTLTYSGDGQRALPLFERYRAAGKPLASWDGVAYGNALRLAGQVPQAIAFLQPLLAKTDSKDGAIVELRTALAMAYQANQQPQEALTALQPLQGNASATLPLARALSTMGRQAQEPGEQTMLYRQAAALYDRVLQQTSTPSTALLREAAEVFSEFPERQATALQYFERLAQANPGDRTFGLQRLALARELGQLDATQLRQGLEQLFSTGLPSGAAQRQSLAQTLVRLDSPDPGLLPLYEALAAPPVGEAVPFLQFRIAQMQAAAGNLAAARASAIAYQATAEGQRNAAPELLLADLDRQAGNLTESARRYETLASRASDAAIAREAQRGLAGILQAQGKWDEALNVYDKLTATNPNDDRAKLGQLFLAYRTGRQTAEGATGTLQEWLDSQPSSSLRRAPELLSLAGALPANPAWERVYQDLLNAEPNNVGVERRLVEVLLIKDPTRAKTRLQERLTLLEKEPPSPSNTLLRAELARLLGERDRASQAYEAVLKLQPDNRDVLMAIAGLRFEQQRYPEATTYYQRLLALNPQDAEVRRLLGELAMAQDQPKTALNQFQAAEALGTGTNERRRVQRSFLRRRGFQPGWERY